MKLSEALKGFVYDNIQYSPRTIALYKSCIQRFIDWSNDPDINEVAPESLTGFLAYLQTEYKPIRFSGDTSPVSPAWVDKFWISLRAFFRWSNETLGVTRPDLQLQRPTVTPPEVIPFSENEIKKILYEAEWVTVSASKEGSQKPHKAYRAANPHRYRNKALVLFLLDTGCRLGEVSRLKIKHVDLDSGEVKIMPYTTGVKSKPRSVFLGRIAKKALWIFLAKRENKYPNDLVFNLTPGAIGSIFTRIKQRTGIDVHPHKFRHTFAIQYLRNGGDIFTLQRILGHNTLKMVRYYLHLADTDAQNAHQRASPADRWRL